MGFRTSVSHNGEVPDIASLSSVEKKLLRLKNYCSGQIGANQGSRQSATTLPFFTQSMLFKLALPKAAQLSKLFVGKLVVFHLLEGPELRTHY